MYAIDICLKKLPGQEQDTLKAYIQRERHVLKLCWLVFITVQRSACMLDRVIIIRQCKCF